ncbi:MAG: hypothetical protein ACJ72Z_09565 [Pyrinomonadaceae bacterium]
MKYCPTCKTRYDEEILRFCMKDGTPLIEEGEPKFTEMPSASVEQEDDPGEVTIIRKKGEIPRPPPEMDEEGGFVPPEPEYRPEEPVFRPKQEQAPRIVVPMDQPRVHASVIPPQQQPKSNTVKIVFLTIFGTLALLVVGALGFWAISRGLSDNGSMNANANNANANVNINTNLGFDSNFNFNGSNSLFNANTTTNTNANVKSPTPSPKPSPSPSPSPSATPEDDETPTPTPRPSGSVPSMLPMNRPSPTPPRMLPANRPPSNRPNNTE